YSCSRAHSYEADQLARVNEAFEALNKINEKWTVELMGATCLFEKYYPGKRYKYEIENRITNVLWDLKTDIEQINLYIIRREYSKAIELAGEVRGVPMNAAEECLKNFCDKLDYQYDGGVA